MPVFEFQCSDCHKRFAKLVGMTADSVDLACPQCGSSSINKLISRFSRGRSEDEVLESFEDKALSTDMENPKAVSSFMREMGQTLADDGEENIDELVDEVEREAYDGESASGGDAEFA